LAILRIAWNKGLKRLYEKEETITKDKNLSRKKAFQIIGFMQDKQAKDITLLDIRGVSNLCDYFIICSGESTRQVKAICEEVKRMCKKNKITLQHQESDESSRWVLIDLSDIMLHVFLEEARNFYDLEYLWNGAKKVDIKKILQQNKI